MNIGILGTGTMGVALASRLERAGHSVLLGTRDVSKKWEHPRYALASYQDAAVFGDLSILALPWPAALQVLGRLALPDRRILVDVSNPENPDGRSLALGCNTSGAEELSRAAPRARLVKALNYFYAELLQTEGTFEAGTPSALYCGDDLLAKECVRALIEDCGFDPVDAGALSASRYLEPLAMLTVALVRDQGWSPAGAAWRLMRSRQSVGCPGY